MEHATHGSLMLTRMGIDTHQEPIVYMRADCHVCRAEGFSAQSRVRVTTDRASIIATLNVVRDGFLGPEQAGLSESAWRLLDAMPGQPVTFSHPRTVESFSAVRGKIFGHAFGRRNGSWKRGPNDARAGLSGFRSEGGDRRIPSGADVVRRQ